MRTPFTSVGTVDQFQIQDPNSTTDSTSSHTKMQQHQTIYHPNAVRQRYSSTTGFGQMETGDDRERTDGRRSRRTSVDRRSSVDRRGSCDTSPALKKQRFEIIRKLGSGTYGKVSLALDHRTGDEVAVKVIKKSAIENTADLIRIRREIRIMSALKHPHIIEIKEVFENDEKIILVMEYSSGGELYDYVSTRGPLGEMEVRRVFRQIVSAVYYCHKHGVAHRDLKLENILLDRNMDAKIADFGLSNYFKPHSLLHTFCGSPLYASPEIINGTPYRGPEVDCWSLGVLLYTLAYSSMPFDGRDFNRMIRQIKRGAYYEPDPPSSASMLIRSMLRVNPDRRADIDMIASHWWLNYDQNLPSISTLQENQVLDKTPLYIRQETLMIQSLGEESEIFAEYSHLSDATKKKIEEFRRRKKEADWYLTDSQSPIKKSKKRSSSVISDRKRQSSNVINQKQGSQATMPSPPGLAKRESSQAVVRPPSAAPGFVPATPPPPAQPPAGFQTTPVPSAAVIGPQVPTPVPSVMAVTAKPPAGPAPSPAAAAKPPAAPAPSSGKPPAGPPPRASPVKPEQQQPTPMPSATKIGPLVEQEPAPAPSSPPKSSTAELAARLLQTLKERTYYAAEERESGPVMDNVCTFQPLPRRPPSVVLKEVIHPERSRCFVHSINQPELRQKEEPPPPAPSPLKPKEEEPVEKGVINEANRLIDELMDAALRGPVTTDIVEKIRSSGAYQKEQFVKEILEAVLVAQQPKPVTSRSMYNFRANRSRSKHSSMSRMPPSASASTSSTPLPDDGDIVSSSPPPPDVVASFNEDISTFTPSAQLTITLPHHKIIHQTVPEEAELELSGSGIQVEEKGDEDEEEEEEDEDEDEEEDEEDVYSTDFEDMEEPSSSSEDEEDIESVGSAKDETDIELEMEPATDIVPISTVDSCASFPLDEPALGRVIPSAPLVVDGVASDNGPTPAGVAITPAESTAPSAPPRATPVQVPRPVTPPPLLYRRGLTKRISRGKYERSKFMFARDIAIQDSPRSSKRRIGGVQPERKDAPKLFHKAKQYILHYPEPERCSPERPVETRRRRYSDGDKKEEDKPTIRSIANPGAIILQPLRSANSPTIHNGQDDPVSAGEARPPLFPEDQASEDCMVRLSAYRRQERARERENIMNDYTTYNGHYSDVSADSVFAPPSSPQPQAKKRTYVTAGEAKSMGAVEPATLQVPLAPKTRRASAEPLLDILEAGGGQSDEYDGGTASYGMPISVSPLTKQPSSSTIEAELRRLAYRPAAEDNSSNSHDGDAESTSSGRNASGITVSLAPMDSEDSPQQATTSQVDNAERVANGGTGDQTRLMSPTSSAFDRNEDDSYSRAYAPGSYRSRSVFVTAHSREMSPVQPRSLMSPLRTLPVDTDPTPAYYYDSRRQKATSWFVSGDRSAGSFEDALLSPNRYSGSARRDSGGNGGSVASYFRSLFDVAYNRVPRLQDLKRERNGDRDREKTPVFLQRESSLKRRSRSVDKSQFNAITIPNRRPQPPRPAVYMPDDRVDVSSHSPRAHDKLGNMKIENLGGAGRFQSLLLSAGPGRSDTEKMPTRGILKKQTGGVGLIGDSERKLSGGDGRRPVTFVDRVRRHMSNDGNPRTGRSGSSSPDSSKPSSKKRSVLQMARRRTTEAKFPGSAGSDSGVGSGSISSDDYSSSTTPIEKLKGFFGGSSSSKGVRETTPTMYSYKQAPGSASEAIYVAAYRKAYQATHRPHPYTTPVRY